MAKLTVPRIFVALAAPTVAALEAQVSRLGLPGVGFELRLDFLKEYSDLETSLHSMLSRLHFPQAIATCRRTEAGGNFSGNIEEQVGILAAAFRAGCNWVDLEIDSLGCVPKSAGTAWLEPLRGARLIVSHHNFRRTPPLGTIYTRLARIPMLRGLGAPAIQMVKIAGQATKLVDNLKYRDMLKRRRSPPLVTFGMGPCGIPSRLLALRWGSEFVYASASDLHTIAPGQLPVEALRSAYRVEHLDEQTRLYGVVGSRASFSLSPPMHNSAFQAKHVNAVYLPCETSRLVDFLEFARRLKLQGFSVTMPFKGSIIKHLNWLDPLAAQIGACNTVAIQNGKWMGWNTDAAAVVEVLTKRLRLAGSRVLILGAGGAARAAAYALRAEGVAVLIAARRETAAKRLARGISAQAIPWDRADGLDVDAVINATPVGMAPYADASPIDLARLRVRVVFDMVTHPQQTRFLTQARGRGLIAIPGLEMLVAQGARQFEIWTGESAPRALMEQAVRQTLNPSAAG